MASQYFQDEDNMAQCERHYLQPCLTPCPPCHSLYCSYIDYLPIFSQPLSAHHVLSAIGLLHILFLLFGFLPFFSKLFPILSSNINPGNISLGKPFLTYLSLKYKLEFFTIQGFYRNLCSAHCSHNFMCVCFVVFKCLYFLDCKQEILAHHCITSTSNVWNVKGAQYIFNQLMNVAYAVGYDIQLRKAKHTINSLECRLDQMTFSVPTQSRTFLMLYMG